MVSAVAEGVIEELLTQKDDESVVFRANGVSYLEGVKRPSFVVDENVGIWIKYGDHDDVKSYYDYAQKRFRDIGFSGFADALVFVEVPPKQGLVDFLLGGADRIGLYLSFLEKQIKVKH